MVAGSILGLVSLVSYSVLKLNVDSSKHHDKKSESSLFFSGYGRHILSQNACATLLVGLTPTNAYQPLLDANYRGYGSNTGSPIQAGHVIKRNHIDIDSFEYRYKDDANIVQKQILGNNFNHRVLQLRMVLRVSSQAGSLQAGTFKLVEKFFELPIIANDGGQIMTCDISMNQAQICEILNLSYDADNNACIPQASATSCIVKGSYATISCSPGGFGCNTSFGGDGNNYFTGAQSCGGADETAYRTGYYVSSYVVGCGKKCSVRIYRYETFYTCMICP